MRLKEQDWVKKKMSVFKEKRQTQKSVQLDKLVSMSANNLALKRRKRNYANSHLKDIFEKNSVFSTEMDSVSQSIGKNIFEL